MQDPEGGFSGDQRVPSMNEEEMVIDAIDNKIPSRFGDEWQDAPNEDVDMKSITSMSCDDNWVKEAESSDDEFSFGSEDEDDGVDDGSSKILSNHALISKEFDIDLLRECIAKGEESIHRIEGKDVILVLGKTGSGKSTLIQGIAGKRFTATSYVCNDGEGNVTAIKDVFDATDPISGFDIGHAKSSMTKHIRCYMRSIDGNTRNDDDPFGKAHSGVNLCYLDTPGFEDTDGEEVDIATSIMLAQVAKKCRSIRFVILVHYVSLMEDRGGAMRSTLKFMRKFVDDFDKHKKSFMFLFSHADEMRSVPESLSGAKKSLLNEIVLTMEATKDDDDAKDLLSFIRKCLQKEYPFVNILHPLKTDFSEMSNFMEQKLKPIKVVDNEYRAKMTTCIFTNSSQMRLIGAVRKLLTNLRFLLTRSPVPIEEVADIKKTFDFFEKYIQFDEMRLAILDCTEIIQSHTNLLYKIIEEEVIKGTTYSGVLFNEANVKRVENSLQQLQVIDSSNFDIEAESNRITKAVSKFQEGLFLSFGETTKSVRNGFHGFHENLQKLRAWGVLHFEYEKLFDLVVSHSNAIVEKATIKVAEFQIELFLSQSVERDIIVETLLCLSILKTIHENKKGLSLYLEGISEASKEYNAFLDRLKTRIEKWDGKSMSCTGERIGSVDLMYSKNIEVVETEVESLIRLTVLAEELKLQDDTSRRLKSIRTAVESRTVDDFATACSNFEGEYGTGKHLQVRQGLTSLRDVAEKFSVYEGLGWKEMKFSYSDLIDRMKSFLKTKSGELDEMSHNAAEHGLANGKRDGQALNRFATETWFDDFLPKQEHFVSNCVVKIRNDYNRRFLVIQESIEETVGFFTSSHCPGKEAYLKAAKDLPKLLMQVIEYSKFGSITSDQDLKRCSSELLRNVNKYMCGRASCWRSDLSLWNRLVSDFSSDTENLAASSESLDITIQEVSEMIKMPVNKSGKDSPKRIQGEIMVVMSDLKKKVEQRLLSQPAYDELAIILARAQVLSDFPSIALYLPQYQDLKEATCRRISEDARKIEELVDETSEFEKIDNLLKKFEKASAVEKFVPSEVSSRLRPLKRLREDKEADVDRVMADMIDKNDFSGLVEFLRPLSRTKNQIQRAKFSKCIDSISKSLKDVHKKLNHELNGKITEANAINIGSYMDILAAAKKEVGHHLPSSIVQTSDGYPSQINRKVQALQKRISTAIERADFVEFTQQDNRTTYICRHLKKYITEDSKREIEKNRKDIARVKDSIPLLIQKYIDSSFSESSDMENRLKNLKMTTTRNNAVFCDLLQLYTGSTKDLSNKVDRLLQAVKKSALDNKCYDDCIVVINNLVRSLANGMKYHLPQNLQDESESLLETWTEARRLQESEMEFKGISVEIVIKKWAKMLEKSAKPTWWPLPFVSPSRTYERLQKELEDKVRQVCGRGSQGLERRDFATLSESFQTLEIISSFTGKHVQLTGEKLRDLERKAIESFLLLCKNAQKVLQANNCREFEQLFVDFRGFVINVTCLMGDRDAKIAFHLTNQLLYEQFRDTILSLERTLDTFEFFAMKQEIEDLRAFGGFVADNFSLFHEELKGCRHINIDEWLEKVHTLISKHFQNGRDLKRIKFYAILGIVPSASKREISSAYRKKSRICHPDRCTGPNKSNDEFLAIKNAHGELEGHALSDEDRLSRPFDDDIRAIGDRLRGATRNALRDQDYYRVENLLFKLHGIEILEDLVSPRLQTEKIREDVVHLVKNHVKKVRTEVHSNWSIREYQDLNENIKDLKAMEQHFKSHDNIFPESWNTGIVKEVECEILSLGTNARLLLKDKKMAESSRDEFRRFFMSMGAVLIELPLFKDHTKKVMSDLLESCLNSNWGYSFVFELGLSLQKGGDADSEKEVRIAQNLVNEFGHFREVLTMVWNEETIQKPPEDSILGIRGQFLNKHSTSVSSMELDTDELLQQYREFDSLYTSFLGEYLNPDADLKALVQKTIKVCESLKPISCDRGFGTETKKALPTIMAGTFALFTILKSGESYNRIEQEADECGIDAKKLLMKPHNIQVLTLLCMFGCGVSTSTSMQSQLMQIRTGEGKSMILGAAAVILGLLGFRVRCICYSEYLSNRDFELFRDVFDHFGVMSMIKYSKITTLSEETTAAKGDIRDLTLSLLRQRLPSSGGTGLSLGTTGVNDSDLPESKSKNPQISQNRNMKKISECEIDSESRVRPLVPGGVTSGVRSLTSEEITEVATTFDKEQEHTIASVQQTKSRYNTRLAVKRDAKYAKEREKKEACTEEIMLVDEVDVFFGPEFYGQTYNQVAELKEPEVATIIKRIWQAHKKGGKRLRLSDIKGMAEYKGLISKIPGFDYLVDNEIGLMLDQVQRVEDEPFYHLDSSIDKIGYKVQDAICYNITYGYRTVFAYLKEADDGKLKDRHATLLRVLAMPISCGQFSYANIKPNRILGVSGTLEAMTDYEKSVLRKYGVNQYLYVPSVYGLSNFSFDKSGGGVSIEKGTGDFFHSITEEVSKIATKQKRAAIVFFKDSKRLNEYTSSSYFRKLGRKKEVLTENKTANEKAFIISKAATSSQITLCTAVFGRGTDFFCKDDTLENNGGVHIIQTFLSADVSEEIQIQGRTARQGKQGTYKLILLDKDLEDDFQIKLGSTESWPANERYANLCNVRRNVLNDKYSTMEMNLSAAKKQDEATHNYFNALLGSNESQSKILLKDLYLNMKKRSVKKIDLDMAFAIDSTGSMSVYGNALFSTIKNLLDGPNSILAKLKLRFPETQCSLRVAVLGYRDIDDGERQFEETIFNGNSHFTENTQDILRCTKKLTSSMDGGADLAEDHLGAIQRCVKWNSAGDWEGSIKVIVLLTDAPAHGYAPKGTTTQNIDSYHVRHPQGITIESVVKEALEKDVDLFVCSFDPIATEKFEETISETYSDHPSNVDGREVARVSLAPKTAVRTTWNGFLGKKHHIFVLDESGSMQYNWAGVVSAYNKYLQSRRQRQNDMDLVSVVQFDGSARVTCELAAISNAPNTLDYNGGGTCFSPAAAVACTVAQKTPSSHRPVIIFMSDGQADDSQAAAAHFVALNRKLMSHHGDLELHVVGFGDGTDTSQLQQISRASAKGQVYTASGINSLSKIYVQIAGGDVVASVLETEISKRISDAVTERLSAEYMG